MSDYRFGYVPNPEGVRQVVASMPHPGPLAAAAPSWLGDGLTGDLMPYLAWFETEMYSGTGELWKAAGVEPPYLSQPGNDCTAEGLSRAMDLLQCIDAATIDDGEDTTPVVYRTCIEIAYAFGLSVAGMRGDSGCYGGALAKAATDIGLVPYRDVDAPHEVTRSRLVQFANNPGAIVDRFRAKAQPYRPGIKVQITTWEEYCALIANQGVATVASNVGYDSPRDSRGIMPASGKWPHQMSAGGVIRSDGVESAVIFQSWGPGNPNGSGRNSSLLNQPQPFHLPSFAFRATRRDFERQLAAGDTWGFRSFGGFERRPLPSKWTNKGWAA
jgi:hypothetical protein